MPHPQAAAPEDDGGGDPPTSEAATVLAQLDRRLQRLLHERPGLASALPLQGRLAREGLLAARPPEAPALPISKERGWAKARDGVPLLHGEAVHVDVAYAGDLFGRLVNVVSATLDEETEEADGVGASAGPVAARIGTLVDAASQGRLDPYALFREAFVQHRNHLGEMASAAGVDADLLVVVASLAVAPLLRSYAGPLAAEYLIAGAERPSPRWRKGYCPVCGSWPVLGELRGLQLQRYLRCGACGTSWPSRRLACVYCETEDFRRLERLQVEGERRLGLDVCDRCRGYLKVLNAFTPTPAPLLSLEDVASAHLDVAAVERGYRRPASAGYRLEIAAEQGEAFGIATGLPT